MAEGVEVKLLADDRASSAIRRIERGLTAVKRTAVYYEGFEAGLMKGLWFGIASTVCATVLSLLLGVLVGHFFF